jgi:hypothetical protein
MPHQGLASILSPHQQEVLEFEDKDALANIATVAAMLILFTVAHSKEGMALKLVRTVIIIAVAVLVRYLYWSLIAKMRLSIELLSVMSQDMCTMKKDMLDITNELKKMSETSKGINQGLENMHGDVKNER